MVSNEPTDGRCNASAGPDNDGYCESYPVTDDDGNPINGRCRMHGGASTGPSAEAAAKNQNAATHSLFSEHDGYFHGLDDGEQEWVFDFTHDLLDRFRRVHNKQPDMFDKEALKNIAIDFHRIAHANGWFRDKGLAHTEIDTSGGEATKTTKINEWAAELRQHNESVYKRMQKHGLLDDPESQKADALGDIDVVIESEIVTEDNADEYVD